MLESIGVTKEEVIKLSFYGDEDKVEEFWESKGLLESQILFMYMQYIYYIDKVIYTMSGIKIDPVTKEEIIVSYSKLLLEEGKTITLPVDGGEAFNFNAQTEIKVYNFLLNEMDKIKENNRRG